MPNSCPSPCNFNSFEVGILFNAYRKSTEGIQRLQNQDPEKFREAQFSLKSLGLINARYELTQRGQHLLDYGVVDTAVPYD